MFYKYFIIINIIGFIICGIDKYLARKNKFRISENTLLIISVIGGCIGFYIGMFIFHHKTKKNIFRYGIPLILIMWLLIVYKGNL